MADVEHMERLRNGVKVWNDWVVPFRERSGDVGLFDLRCAQLEGAELAGVILPGADLAEAQLVGANLSGAILVNNNLSRADLRGADLREADLVGADLSHSNLGGADMTGAKLIRANLGHADLTQATLRCDLSFSNLSYANLTNADFTEADLTDARLDGANMRGAILNRTNLEGVHLSDAIFGFTILVDIDLSIAGELEAVKHEGPSSIGLNTLYESHGRIPEGFLRQAGVPEDVIQHLLPRIRHAK
jgi:uncharacterized protein YjbI with pentapeptide repeats